MPIDLFMALQFLREGKTQSILISAAVGVGVAVIVFLSALIGGLQEDLIAKTLGTQAHVSLRRPEEQPRPQWNDEVSTALTRSERAEQRQRGIPGWQQTAAELTGTPGVEAVSPLVAGAAFAVRGTVTKSISLLGVQPDRYVEVIDIPAKLERGRMVRGGTEAVIGVALADDLGLDLGAKLRVQSSGGQTELFTVVGIFDLGNQDVNRRWVVTPLRAGQTLLDHVGTVSQIDLRLPDPFDADRVAGSVAGRTGLDAESWMQTNAQLLTALRSQRSSSIMIQFFVIVAVCIGIASVLVVSVVQKRRQIGIMRAMGISRARIARIFLYQGGFLGFVGSGSAVGVGLGALVARLFARAAVDPEGNPLFPIILDLELVLTASSIAVVTGLIAAVLPAIRASRLDPAEAIRNE
jgi:lipoprotein-releasing system permease protein